MKKCEYCAEEVQDDVEKCNHCGERFQENYRRSEGKQAESQFKKEPKKLEGFEGWLAFFGFVIFSVPIIIFFLMITEPQSYAIFINILNIVAYIWLNYLMVKKRKVFNKWFLRIGLAQIILLGLIVIGVTIGNNFYTPQQLYLIYNLFFGVVYYVTLLYFYLWNSKRVKNTFIN